MFLWREHALCESLSWEEKAYFFGADPVLGTNEQHELARECCYTCPVQTQCLTYCVLSLDMEVGVWGGLTESQRKRYLRPAIRDGGLNDETLQSVILACGFRIFKRIDEKALAISGA